MVGKNKPFQSAINVVMILLSLAAILPIILLVISSFTDEVTLGVNGFSFFPEKLSLGAYAYLWFSRAKVFRAYGMTILITFVGTIINLIMTFLMAYSLSRKDLPGRNFFSFFVFFTMLFRGGLVPSYIMWTQLINIKDTFLALIVPNLLCNSFFIIMMRTYISMNIPEGLIEAARLDGASELRILTQVVSPLSKPMIATVALMVGLAYWNDWQNGLYFILKRKDLFGIQSVLNAMISNAAFLANSQNTSGLVLSGGSVPTLGIRMAVAVVALLPIMIIYPFFQKSFVKGIVVGGIKG